jgi:hypothetical protein
MSFSIEINSDKLTKILILEFYVSQKLRGSYQLTIDDNQFFTIEL